MWTRLIAEIRILGGATVRMPLVVGIAYIGVARVVQSFSGTHSVSLFLSWFVIQGVLPLLVGFLMAGLGRQESAGELALTWPIAYGRLALGRFWVVLGSGVLAVSPSFFFATLWHIWPQTLSNLAMPPVTALAEWVGCLLAIWGCAALGWGGAILLRSAATSRVVLALVGSIGLLGATGIGTLRGWVTLQLSWLIVGCLTLWGGWWRIRQPAWAIAQQEEDL